MKYLIFLLLLLVLNSCFKGKKVDLIIHNAKIHVLNESNDIEEAIAIKDGEVVEVGPERQILNKYRADEYVDAAGKDVFPGFADSHTHMMMLARQMLSANLVGCVSMEDLVVRMEKYDQRGKHEVLIGRGWDQNLWRNTALPTNELLNEKFPEKPVVLYRIDAHAVLVNEAALKRFGIDEKTKVDGGEILKDEQGRLTGVLLDNAISLVSNQLPDFSEKELIQALLEIQQELLAYGVTDVHEAGLSYSDFRLLDRLVTKKQLVLGVYGMLFPSDENIAFAKKNGVYANQNLLIRSFKVIGDGALGSRGACLKKPYADDQHNHGLLTVSPTELRRIVSVSELTGYQVNIHAIGDSTNRLVLELIHEMSEKNPDHRWRLEHAQVLDPRDLKLLQQSGAFPSVQPTHAVSDYSWAFQRLGAERMKGAYAYKQILEYSQMGMLALGTDFPIESNNPFLTIHAAINRTNQENIPSGGFQSEDALDEFSCLRGMTIWPAFASFMENRKGTLEKGKDATLVILQNPFRTKAGFQSNYAYQTYIQGVLVYGER